MALDQPRSSVTARLVMPVALAIVAMGCGAGASPSPTASAAPPTASTAPTTASAAPTTSATPSGAAGSIAVGLSQFKVELGATSVASGSVTFEVTNNGTIDHEFVIFRTDLPADQLPLSADGTTVDEEGQGVTAVDEIAEFAPGKTKTLTVDLPAGRYVLICNVPTHYGSGMHAEFTTDGP